MPPASVTTGESQMNRFVFAALGAFALCAAALPAQAQNDCPAPTDVVVQSAQKYPPATLDDAATDQQKQAAATVQLGDTIELTIQGLDKLQTDAECRKSKGLSKRTLVLFLAGQAMKGLTGYVPQPPAAGKMRYVLAHTEESKAAWALVLAKPWARDRTLEVSVGYEDAYPFNSSATVPFRKLATVWAVLGVIFMLVLVGAFIALLWLTDMCREGRPAVPSDTAGIASVSLTAYGPFSLSKVQAGIWFLIILGAYIFIVTVTHDISGTINTTALTLMGIGAATMVGSAVITTNQGESANAEAQADVARVLADRIQELKTSQQTAATNKELRDLEIAFRRATNQSIGLWNDIVSDANGVNFHRFQMAAWTVVLAFIFAVAVTRILAMPDFDSTLLALQGLSAGTYLGLKVSESKVTDVPEKPRGSSDVSRYSVRPGSSA
jgi:hypothetical protein